MKTYTLDQYRKMSSKFNSMSFYDQIKTLKENSDILTLASDGNWWGVKVKDKEIEEQLLDLEENFDINEREWGSREMSDLVYLLGIDNTDI